MECRVNVKARDGWQMENLGANGKEVADREWWGKFEGWKMHERNGVETTRVGRFTMEREPSGTQVNIAISFTSAARLVYPFVSGTDRTLKRG